MLFCKIAGAKVRISEQKNKFYLSFLLYFRIFAAKFNDFMRKRLPLLGILLIIAGTLVLLTAYLLHHTTNPILLTGILLVLGGVVAYVLGVKQSNF